MSENYKAQVNNIMHSVMSECQVIIIVITYAKLVFQLNQVNQAIDHTESIDQLNELLSLRDNLVELIALTNETCEPKHSTQNPLDEEYALFKVISVQFILNFKVNQSKLFSRKLKPLMKHKTKIMMKMIRRPVKF